MNKILLGFMLALLFQMPAKAVSINASSVSKIAIEDIPLGATHYKAFTKTVKGSNLKLAKNKKRRKIQKGSAFLKLKSGEKYSSHTVSIVFYKKTKSRMRVVSASSQEIVIDGDMSCPVKKSSICGIKYIEKSCNPLDNREICFFGFEPVRKTYEDGLCGLEADGAEFLHVGKCNN